ncbi:MAG: DNA repair protein RecO [Gemmatimonadaceae bacterium]
MIETEAIVLHAFDYRETSRIVRLATRDVGVISAVARGARRPRSKFGQGLDLFTGGTAHLILHASSDLHALTAFDASRARPALAGSLQRFGAAAALCELCLRFGTEAPASVHQALSEGLDALAVSDDPVVAARALAAAWRIVAELGFGPSLDQCVSCHRALADDEEVRFAHRAGGAVCSACRDSAPGARALPSAARRTLRTWLDGDDDVTPDTQTAKAHQRLLREFLEEHLVDGRPLRAWAAWERLAR